jgi:hypothetical protein
MRQGDTMSQQATKKVITFRNDDGTEVLIQVNDVKKPGPGDAGVSPTELAREKFQEGLKRLKPIADSVMGTLHELNNPEEISIEFGITFSAETGVVIASASAEANISVSLKWSNKPKG